MSTLRVAVLGAEKVGKSAVTVRFLTRRFIGEYNSLIDLLYRSSVRQQDNTTDIEILDTCSRKNSTRPDESHVQWADAFVIVYDICNKQTLQDAKQTLAHLAKMKSPFVVPILLLANKRDLDHLREVGVDEGHEVALENGCQFYEVSAAEMYMQISIAFQALLRDAKITQQQRSSILRRRRSSLLSMSRKLGAIFGKKGDDSDKKRPSCDVPNFALSF